MRRRFGKLIRWLASQRDGQVVDQESSSDFGGNFLESYTHLLEITYLDSAFLTPLSDRAVLCDLGGIKWHDEVAGCA